MTSSGHFACRWFLFLSTLHCTLPASIGTTLTPECASADVLFCSDAPCFFLSWSVRSNSEMSLVFVFDWNVSGETSQETKWRLVLKLFCQKQGGTLATVPNVRSWQCGCVFFCEHEPRSCWGSDADVRCHKTDPTEEPPGGKFVKGINLCFTAERLSDGIYWIRNSFSSGKDIDLLTSILNIISTWVDLFWTSRKGILQQSAFTTGIKKHAQDK